MFYWRTATGEEVDLVVETARAGLLLHAGSALEWLTPDVLVAPWWKVV